MVRDSYDIAPRVLMYSSGSVPPPLAQGWVALAQLPPRADRPVVFGDGSHATTRLCAAAVDLLCRQRQPQTVLDVGTGTGVLARIARARGASTVVGTDIDPDALSSARANSNLDAHPAAIHFSDAAPDQLGMHFDLVVANILEAPLRVLAPALCRALRPGGILLLSGFTRPQAPALRVLYEGLRLTFVRESLLGEWALLAFACEASPAQRTTATTHA
jgi:ribosomal protein L11 methyltransferase